MGGTNFWGGTKEDDCFLAPSFDDVKCLKYFNSFTLISLYGFSFGNLENFGSCSGV